MLRAARISTEEWQGFLEDFVGDPDIIARVKDMKLRWLSGAYGQIR